MGLDLFLVRGLPGSGKSTLAKLLTSYVYEADDYFMRNGRYEFNPSLVPEAHRVCQAAVGETMQAMEFRAKENCGPMERFLAQHRREIAARPSTWGKIAVANTFTQHCEMKPYLELAKQYGFRVTVIVCVNEFANTHNVPASVIEKMRERWED